VAVASWLISQPIANVSAQPVNGSIHVAANANSAPAFTAL